VVIALLVGLLTLSFPVVAQDAQTGNVIFLHPDGTGVSHWNAARMYWYGPDANLNWDMLPEMAVYRGHMSDRLTGTSNGGATVHAFGHKVLGPGSYGQDGGDEDARPILSLSGYSGSIMREAGNNGHPIGVVNDGDAAEPGTGAFLAEVSGRDDPNGIALQIVRGREGMGDTAPAVVLGGGEAFFLPVDAPMCEGEITPACYVHTDPVSSEGPAREDGLNLIQEAIDNGWTVLRTRAEFEALMAELEADPALAPSVLGLFARDDMFNDEPEETLISLGLVDEAMADSREGSIILWGGLPETMSYNPPTVAEMSAMALMILERRATAAGLPFLLVTEVESTDNLPNNANAIGMLNAVKHADDTIAVFREFIDANPNTMLVTAADSDGGAPQVFSPAPRDDNGNVTTSGGNPTGLEAEGELMGFALDGIMGQGTAAFESAPDAFGNTATFAIGWPGTNDVAGGILSRAQGLNAEMLRTEFYMGFDSTDVYRLMYVTLFGEMLPSAIGVPAPDRAG
jgi:alkaline phosphatase